MTSGVSTPVADRPSAASVLERLIDLSHQLGCEERRLAILGEGNTSARANSDTIWVKASGANLGTLSVRGVVECRPAGMLDLLNRETVSDAEVGTVLEASRVDPSGRRPSVEAIFHAYLLSLPGVSFVGHSHPVAVNQVMCSKHARHASARRLFPDEVVCCGPESVFVPYIDPGLPLARGIRAKVGAYARRLGHLPRVILLQNHGFIALGATPEAVLAATLMGTKAAEIFVGAAVLGGGNLPRFLTSTQVARIAGRTDEHYRQRALGL